MEVLKAIDKRRYDVTMISPNTYRVRSPASRSLTQQVFTPLLAGTAVGTLEFRAALDPVRYRARNASYTQAWADGIDLDKRLISVTAATSPIAGRKEPDRYQISYDKLVLAPGACPSASVGEAETAQTARRSAFQALRNMPTSSVRCSA